MNSSRRSVWRTVRRLSLSLAVLMVLSIPGTRVVGARSVGAFAAAGDMTTARSFHTAIALRDGKVLIVGGSRDRPASAEIYDPAAPALGTAEGSTDSAAFTATGDMTTVRDGPTGTVLRDGKVLIAGGDRFTGHAPLKSTAELYDPSTGTFTPTGDMVTVQIGGTATLLNDGKVLIAGGVTSRCCDPAPVANPELYDPSTGTFTLTGTFQGTGDGFFVTGGPNNPTATLLPDGKVLIAGEPTAELYDPVTGTFSLTGAMTTPCVLGGHPMYISGRTATLLTNGKVLLAGGEHEDCGRFADAELYDPASGTFTATGSMTRARDNHTATLLLDGTVLIAGGESQDCSLRGCIFSGTDASAELYDPSTGTFAAAGNMTERRAGHTAIRIKGGAVLITGGYFYAGIGISSCCFASAELYRAAGLSAPVRAVTSASISAALRLAVPGDPSPDHGVVVARPSGVVATASGSGVVLTWIGPSGVTPLRYAISGGDAPHTPTLPVVVTPDASTRYTIPALRPGHYYFTVSAILTDGLSPLSDEADVIASGSTSATGPPSGALAMSDGRTFTVTWTGGQEIAAVYDVEIGSAPGRADVATITTSQSAVTYRADAGTYYLRVRAARAAAVSQPSNEVSVRVAPALCAAAPLVPVLLPVSTTDGETTIAWLPAGGPPADHYRVIVTGPSGQATMISGNGTSLTAALEPGIYAIRVAAINACGASAASNQIAFMQPNLVTSRKKF